MSTKKNVVRWKKGAKCSICGTEVKEAHLSKDSFKRNYELKWCLHWACHEKLLGIVDREDMM